MDLLAARELFFGAHHFGPLSTIGLKEEKLVPRADRQRAATAPLKLDHRSLRVTVCAVHHAAV